jgi:hypothetical protein
VVQAGLFTLKLLVQKILHSAPFQAGVILAVTGIAKAVSALGGAPALRNADPILGWQFDRLIFAVGVVELLLASLCLCGKAPLLASTLVAWFATILLAYRLGLWWIGRHRPCACFGNLTDALHISPQTADTAMKIILAYLLIGSYAILFREWWKRMAKSASVAVPYRERGGRQTGGWNVGG